MTTGRLRRRSEERARALRILGIVKEHRGRGNAIDMHAIAASTGYSTREIQSLVKSLVEEHHVPIGSATSRPFGYFWIASEEERRACRGHFVRRALSNLNHAKAFDSDKIVAKLIGQLEIDFGTDLKETL